MKINIIFPFGREKKRGGEVVGKMHDTPNSYSTVYMQITQRRIKQFKKTRINKEIELKV